MEEYSGNHSESFEELLEWPYRRFHKAFDAWQRRKTLNELETKKNLHISALHTITEWKEDGDQQKAVEDVEKYYELLKDMIWEPEKSQRENEEMKALEDADPFLKAGKRNLAKILPPKFPNQENIEDTLNG